MDDSRGVCYRDGPLTTADYNEAINDLYSAREQRKSMARGEFQSGCAVCGDSGHTVEGCHHDPLCLARERAKQKSTWRCWHCGFEARMEAEAVEHFGSSEEEVARCLRSPTDAAQLAEAREEIAQKDTRIAELEATLRHYADTFCEFGSNDELCGKAEDDTCSGCKARAALSRAKTQTGDK